MRTNPLKAARTVWLSLYLSLAWLATACGIPGGTGEPATATLSPSAPATPATRATTAASAPTDADTVRLILVPGDNEARYRVREQLASLSFPSDAVGATREVTGTIVAKADGTVVSNESMVQVDLRTLRSNESRRDNFLRMNTLQTNRFPYADFVPTAVQGLALPPPRSGPVEFKLIGDLTIRSVTKPVTWDVRGRVEGDEAFGQATTSFTFDYFNLTRPRVAVVLSVEDTIRLEIDLHLRRVIGP